MPSLDYSIEYPTDYETEQWIWEAKGYIVLTVHLRDALGGTYTLTFREPERLAQDVAADIAESGLSLLSNDVVVPRVTQPLIESSVASLAADGFRGLAVAS